MDNSKLNFIHLCDYASISDAGKLNIMGSFENIFSNNESFSYPQFYIVTNIKIEQAGNFKQTIKIIRDSDETQVTTPLEFNISIPKIEENKKSVKVGFIGQINNIKFESFGSYSVQIFIDAEKIGEEKFLISKPELKSSN